MLVSVDAGGNRSTRRKPVVFGKDKLTTPNFTCNQRKFPDGESNPGYSGERQTRYHSATDTPPRFRSKLFKVSGAQY